MLSPTTASGRCRKAYHDHPFVLRVGDDTFTLDYAPAESKTSLFGGNSNWRGPVWFPLNYLLIEALQKHDAVLGDSFKIECPDRIGLRAHAVGGHHRDHAPPHHAVHARRERTAPGERRPRQIPDTDPHWRDLIVFHEYFHGDTGEGLGASHQTGWTGVVAKLIHQYAEYAMKEKHDLREVGLGAWEKK